MADMFNRIKSCETMRELDELRIDIVHAMESGDYDNKKLQKEFIRKVRSLRRNGHTRVKEGYTLREIIDAPEREE